MRGHFILIAYEQLYQLIEAKQHLAAILTARALLETIAIEHGDGDGDRRTFKDKLEALQQNDFIRSREKEFLERVIYDAGSAAMHRSYNPSPAAVTYVVDAIERLIHTIYIEPIIATKIGAEKPPRG